MSTAMTIDRIAAQIVRADMLAVARYAKEIMEANRMEQPSTCTYAYNGTRCPIGAESCAGCGWDATEAVRRCRLPLVKDEETGKSRKFVGRKPDANPG